jgi:hypothetical protein
VGTRNGVVHAWVPEGYRPRGAGIVLYLHGYYTDADQAFLDHRLAEQFRASRRNAIFLVAESPSWSGEDVWWQDLDSLLAEVAALADLHLPSGPVVAVGHSGAFRTILSWLPSERLAEVILLDGLYRGEDAFASWLAGAGGRRLVLVGQDTAPRTEAWLAGRPDAVRRDRIPARAPGADRDREAPLLYLRSQYDHMALVTSGEAMPALLRASRLKAL